MTSKNQWSKNGPISSHLFSLLIACWQPSLQLSIPFVVPRGHVKHGNALNTWPGAPIPPGLQKIHTEETTTVSHLRVNCSQHVPEQACPHQILKKSHLNPRSVASWLVWPHSQLCCPVGTKTYRLSDSASQYSREIAFYKKCHPSSAEARKFKSLPRAGADILSNWMLPL